MSRGLILMTIDLFFAESLAVQIPRIYQILGAFALLVFGGGGLAWYYYFNDYHFATVQQGVLYRDGFRSEREFNIAIANARPKWVVSLLDDNEIIKEPFTHEITYLSRTRIKAERIPIKLGGYPNTEQIRRFLKIVETPHYQPVLVHCAQGIRRTGMMVAAYQLSVLGWDKEKAKENILAFGHSERTINDIKKFIDAYDPIAREITQDLGKGTE